MSPLRKSATIPSSGPLGEFHVGLLEGVRKTGSISKAAARVGISYRTAWNHLDRLNALSNHPLVERAVGGKSGGGTSLTAYGEGLLKAWYALSADHAKAVEDLSRQKNGKDGVENLLRLTRRISLKTSARNQLFGTVESIRRVGIEAEIKLHLKGKGSLISRITWKSVQDLDLRKGTEAFALIKANWVQVLSPKTENTKKWNVLTGIVQTVSQSKSRSEIVLRLDGGELIVATSDDKPRPGSSLKKGERLSIAIDPANVIVGVH